MTVEQIYSIFKKHPVVSTDTRNIIKDSIFFALKGAHFDGNEFTRDALEKGASFAVVDDKTLAGKANHIWVEDVLTTFKQLANFHRKQLGIPIIGITGSNGKTTTKELVSAVLERRYRISFTQGNLNNHIGVPLTLLKMSAETEIGVVEMGANHQGEIAELCKIAEPDYGIITNVGKAHLEGFGSFKGVIKAKSELYDFLRDKNKPCFINIDNEHLTKRATGLRQFSYGTSEKANLKGYPEESTYYLTVKVLFPKGWLFLRSKLIGSYNFENILAAARVGQEFNIDPLEIQKAIENYVPSNNRSQLINKGSNKIIMDAYNANPTSMAASLNNLLKINHNKKVAILGDMLELGEDSVKEHQTIAELISGQNLDKIFLVGEQFMQTHTDKKIKKFENTELLYDYLHQQKNVDNSLILIKGSRGIQLEKILELL